jgi:hypothetical protein
MRTPTGAEVLSQFDEFDPLQLALMRLHERLEIARVYFEEGDQRTSTQGALRAIIEFLRSISGFSESHLAPFRKLLSASAGEVLKLLEKRLGCSFA